MKKDRDMRVYYDEIVSCTCIFIKIFIVIIKGKVWIRNKHSQELIRASWNIVNLMYIW